MEGSLRLHFGVYFFFLGSGDLSTDFALLSSDFAVAALASDLPFAASLVSLRLSLAFLSSTVFF